MTEMDSGCHDFRTYDFPVDQIPRFRAEDPRVDELIGKKKPVIITDSRLVDSALKWDLDYLENNMGDSDFLVIYSKDHTFKFYDERKLAESGTQRQKNQKYPCPTREIRMKMREFGQRIRKWKPGDERMYLQQGLNSNLGPTVKEDIKKFQWDWATAKQGLHNWGEATYNLLFIGLGGNVTPCHYDEQENLFAQIHGYKRCILFSPDQFERLYPHPVHHPHDRQSQVDFDNPDFERFPKLRGLRGHEAIVGPGEVLHIPCYWWHIVESEQSERYTVSVNFWYKTGPVGQVQYPLGPHQKVAIMRNVEKMLGAALKDPEEIGPLLRTLVFGRFTE